MYVKFIKNANLNGIDYTADSPSVSVTEETGNALITAGSAIEVDEERTNSIVIEQPKQNTLAVVGDSISAMLMNSTYLGNSTKNTGFINWGLSLSGHRLKVVSFQAAGGSGYLDTGVGVPMSTQMDAAVLSGAGHIILLCGINDFTQRSRTVDEVWAQVKITVARAKAAGMTVWLCTLTPIDSGHAYYSAALVGKIMGLNARIRQLVGSENAKSGVYLVDLWKTQIDPLSTTGNQITGYTTDGLHPNNKGAKVMGTELARMWSLYVPEVSQLVTSVVDDYVFDSGSHNIIDNGLFTVGAAPGTGWAVTATGGASSVNTLVARADGVGNDLTMTLTFASAGTYEVRINNYKTRMVSGDTYTAICEVSVSNPVNIYEPVLAFGINTTGGTAGASPGASAFVTDSSNQVVISDDYTAMYKTEPLLYTSELWGSINASSLYLTVTATAAGSAVVKIGRVSLVKVVA